MNLKIRLIVIAIAFLASGIYVTFFSEPARMKVVAKLESATTNEVISSLGRPYRIVDSANFAARANEMAEEGFPISKADTTARGMVWLYPDGGIKHTAVRNYKTVFFDESNRVAGIHRTYWAKDPWTSNL